MRALARVAAVIGSGRPAGAAPRCALRPPHVALRRQPLLLAMPPVGAPRAGATLAPTRVAGAWRTRLLGARGLAQRGSGGHAAAASSASADDTPSLDSPAKPHPPPPPHRLLKYVAAFAVFGLAGNSFGPMLPALAAQVQVSAIEMSPVMVASGAGGIAGALLCPLLPLTALLPGGLLAMGATFSMVPLAGSVTQLAALFAMGAACSQGVAIGGHALLARQLGPAAGPALNSINAAFGAGSLFAPLAHSALAPALRDSGGVGSAGTASYVVVAALLCAAAAPFAAALRASPAPAAAEAHAAAAAAPSADATLRAVGGRDGALLTASVLGLVACCVGAEACYGVWLYTYASTGPLQLPAGVAAAAVSCFWTALTGGRLLAVAASSRVPPAAILRVSLPLALAGPAVALALPSSPVALTAGVALAGLGVSCGFANAVALLARHVAPTGTTQALIQLAACTGGLVFAPLVGQLQSGGVLGADAFLYVAAACAAADVAFLAAAEAAGARLARKHKDAHPPRVAAEQP